MDFCFYSCTNMESQNPSEPQKNEVKETFPIDNLVDEVKETSDSIINMLHAQHHAHKVLERRTIPGPFKVTEMKYYSEHAVTLDQFPVINPDPGEYVHVMEGQRHGYNNLVNRDARNSSRRRSSHAYT